MLLYAILSTLLYVMALSIKVFGHIGEPCNSLLKMCLPLSTHMYCDANNICQCKSEFPVQVGAHSCRSARKVHERCSHPEECVYNDRNSYCTQTPYSSQCECHEGFVFDKTVNLCVEQKGGKPSSTVLIIPTAAGFLMACFSLLCCCVLIWHNVCRNTDTRPTTQSHVSERARRNRTNDGFNRNMNNNNNDGIDSHLSPLPPYESVLILHSEPPPSYEDAIKATSSDTIVESKT